MDKTRKLSAVLGDDELFKQKALESTLRLRIKTRVVRLVMKTCWRCGPALTKHRPNVCVPDPHARQRRAEPDTLLTPARVSFAVRSVSGAAGLTK